MVYSRLRDLRSVRHLYLVAYPWIMSLLAPIGHEGFVGLSVSIVHICATRWRLFTLTAVALRFCRATEKMPSIGGIKRRATARSLNDLP
jgi:hypothetical protein